MKKKAGIKFEFTGDFHSNDVPDRRGMIGCSFCGARYKLPCVGVNLYDFQICPSCIQSGLPAIAAEVGRIAGDKGRIARIWREKDPEFLESMAGAYRELYLGLRGYRSFEELPSGKVALVVAGALRPEDRGRKGKAARTTGR